MLQRSSLAYISVLWLLFQLLVEINCQITPFKPRQRYAHTATLINDKLYILGGGLINDSYNVGKDFFYLDFSVKFDTAQDSLWQDLSNINTVPSHFSAASVKGGKNNNTLILYGGINSTAMELVYMYDQQSNSWSTPKLAGPRDTHLTGVTNYNGNMYLWGGVNGVKLEADIMLILDTTNFNLKSGNLTDAPVPSHNYGAVLLPNNNIIYMGGYSMGRNADLALDQIYIYDTINNKWSTQATKGTVPSARRGFSAVLGLDGQRIIIFGGTTSTTIDISITDEKLKPEDSLYVLDLTNFEWSTPKIAGTIPNSRVYHRANVIGKYMVISFGDGYNQSNESDILLLDIGNNEEYIWTNKFDPKISSSLTSPKIDKPQTKNDASPIMIAIMTTSLFGTMILFFGAYFLYKWNKNKQKQSKATFIIPKGEEQDDLPVISIGKTRFSMANNIGHINNINPT